MRLYSSVLLIVLVISIIVIYMDLKIDINFFQNLNIFLEGQSVLDFGSGTCLLQEFLKIKIR